MLSQKVNQTESEVISHSGFGSWLSSFQPGTGTAVELPTQHNAHELPVNDKIPNQPVIYELPTEAELAKLPVQEAAASKNHHCSISLSNQISDF